MRPEAGKALIAAAVALRVGASQALSGWTVLLGRCLFYVLIMTVLAALWDKVAAEPAAGAVALPAGGLVLYVLATEWITLSLPAVHLRFEDDIRSGGLEPHLLRPKAYLLQMLAQSLGGVLVRLAMLGITAVAWLAVTGRPGPPAMAYPYLIVLGVLAVVVGMLLYAIAGLCAFWTRRVLPFQLVIQKLMFLLGGLFAPISLYPDWLRQVGEASPFAAHLYWAGVQALTPSGEMFLRALGWQVLWIALLAALCVAMWRAGLAKVLREGGV